MAIYFENLKVNSFRGIKNLFVENLNHINIIAGDNNSGKTSVLEAMLLLKNTDRFDSIFNIIRARGPQRTPNYEKFINLFCKGEMPLQLSAGAKYNGVNVDLVINGNEEQLFISKDEIDQNRMKYGLSASYNASKVESVEAREFSGKMSTYLDGKKVGQEHIQYNSYERMRNINRKSDTVNMVYLSPFEHIEGTILNRVTQNEAYKELCINILRIFDEDIKDILILENDRGGYSEYIRHDKLGNMPLYTYGDGIKKVIAIANAIAQSSGGILLIDEIDTAIHAKHYHNIFSFVTKACRQFQVQLFVTTHSIEAIEALLATQNYNSLESDDISVITFRKRENKTYARVLKGKEVAKNRDEFDFEVRI